jgi:phytoene desaturase
MTRQVIIIGAGPGGLGAAMLLAKAGLHVRVFERLAHVGGRTSAIEVDGFRFDCGPTFFLYPRVLKEIFAAVGHDLMEEVPMARLEPQYRLVFGAGGSLDCTPNVPRMEEAVAAIQPNDAPAFRRFLDHNRAKLARFRPCLETPFLGWGSVLTGHMMALLPYLRPWLSLDGELKRFFSDSRLRLAFSFQSKYLGMSPFQCPSLFSILSFLEYGYGVFHPMGGCNAVTQRMAQVAEELGAEIALSEPVEEILFEGRRAVGVRTSSGKYRADAVVVNADFARAMTRLVPNRLRPRWSDEALQKKRFSCSTFMLYLGVEGRCEELAHHTIFIPEGYRTHLDEVEHQHVLSEEPSFYVQNACVTDASLAPPGMSALYVLVPVTHQHPNVDWERQRDRYRSLVLKRLALVGLSDVEKRIRVEQILTPADWDQQLEI